MAPDVLPAVAEDCYRVTLMQLATCESSEATFRPRFEGLNTETLENPEWGRAGGRAGGRAVGRSLRHCHSALRRPTTPLLVLFATIYFEAR